MNVIQDNSEYLAQLNDQLEIRTSEGLGYSTRLSSADCGALRELLMQTSFSDNQFLKMLERRAQSGTGTLMQLDVNATQEIHLSLKELK